MTSYSDLTRAVTCKFNDQIKRSCRPLFEYFNLNYFCFVSINCSGGYSYFANNIDWSEYYGSNEFHLSNPFQRHPKLFCEGVYLLKNNPNNELSEISRSAIDDFGIDFSLKLINKTNDGFEAFILASPSSDQTYFEMLLNELPMVRLFIKKFREENEAIFRAAEENQMDLGGLLGPAFYQNSIPAVQSPTARHSFLKKMGIDVDAVLSVREIEVIKLLLEGYSAAKIAPQIYLSRRTVEHHIERIKDKLGCGSKAELIQKARELDQFGVLNNLGMN